MSQIICIKLITQEELVGVLEKEYSAGDVRIKNVMVLCPAPNGFFLDPYMIGGTNEQLEIRSHAIVTTSQATEKLVDLFLQTTKFNEDNAAEVTKKVVN